MIQLSSAHFNSKNNHLEMNKFCQIRITDEGLVDVGADQLDLAHVGSGYLQIEVK
jgi:hypothetical protein